MPTTSPDSPSRTTIGKRTRDSPTARSTSPPGLPNGRIASGAARMNSAVNPPRISSERAHEVRDLESDGEGVDPAADAEVVGSDHLACEAEGARESGRQREDGCRAGETATRRRGLGAVDHLAHFRHTCVTHL